MWSSLLDLIKGINPNVALTGVIQALGLVFANIKSHWRIYLILLLSGLLLGSSYGWSHEHDLLLKEKAAHQLDITNFKKAQADANTKAQDKKTALLKESKANADQADAKYVSLLAEYRANLVRYKANQSASGQSNYRQLSSTESGNGPSSGSELSTESLVISGDDAQICAVNTARLQAVHDWAINPPKDGIE